MTDGKLTIDGFDPQARITALDWKPYALLAGATGLSLLTIALSFRGLSHGGWDFDVYCTAAQVFRLHDNPYHVANIESLSGVALSYNYPPVTLPLWEPLCALGHAGYASLWGGLLLATAFVTLRLEIDHSVWWLLTLLITGFAATYWNFYTGNTGLVGLLLFAVVIYFLHTEHITYAAVTLGVLSAIKLFPLAFGALFLFREGGLKQKMKPVATLLAVVVAIHLVSWLLYPSVTHDYYLSLFGLLEQQYTPGSEFLITNIDGIDHPSSLLFFQAIATGVFGVSLVVGILAYGCYLLLVSGGSIAYVLARREEFSFFDIFVVGTVLVLAILPRLKPYSFTSALVPLYLLTVNRDLRTKFAVLFATGAFPLAANLLLAWQTLDWLPLLIRPVLNVGLNFNQLLGLLFVTGYLLYTNRQPTAVAQMPRSKAFEP